MPYACTYRRACCSTSPLNACRSAKQHRDNGDAKGLLEAVRQLSSLELQLAFLRREGGPNPNPNPKPKPKPKPKPNPNPNPNLTLTLTLTLTRRLTSCPSLRGCSSIACVCSSL